MLAGQAWPLLQELGELDAPALARALMTKGDVGATPANVVATAAVSFCETYGVHALTAWPLSRGPASCQRRLRQHGDRARSRAGPPRGSAR